MPDQPRQAKTRFAPSPTGLLHLGNARAALFNRLLANRLNGCFLLRVEDTDAGRSRDDYQDALYRDLRWLGCDWDEGPERDGDAGPYRQSERGAIYRDYYHRLLDNARAYRCFCTSEELERMRREQRRAGKPPRYTGACAHLHADEVALREAAGEPHSLRFRVTAGIGLAMDDLVRGPQHFRSDEIGDFVIRRSDGSAAFFFGNAVDDALMGVTHVVRGDDHLTNTPRQMLILNALGLPVPAYGHLPLMLGDDGTPLSKRNGSVSVSWLREEGVLPEALVNYLARLGHRYDADELLDTNALAEHFDLARVSSAPARFDRAQLAHWQRRALDSLDAAGVERWLDTSPEVAAALQAWLADSEQRRAVAELIRPNIDLPRDALPWLERLFGEAAPDTEAKAVIREAGADFFEAALDALDAGADDPGRFPAELKTRSGQRGRRLFMPLRAALTGVTHGPEIAGLLAVIPPQRIRVRLRRCRDIAAGCPS